FDRITLYNGELISLDYAKIKPESTSFCEYWEPIELAVLEHHSDQFKEIQNDFVRALSIIRSKNPSRGSKRKQDTTSKNNMKNNPLSGIIEWIQMDDDPPQTASMIPVLYVRGEPLKNSEDCVIRWSEWSIPVLAELKLAFNILLETFTVLNVQPAPTDRQFFLFLRGAVLHTATLSTTGAKFLHSL
ncbi:uncharacterized protein LOC135708574, partial [Ochlerotatus camptorhynchus]|uniref:uncharacterized protein LOC135708574 n=1 Tax=Ochlerotatus camptorhynchus TaxID=644619 RepID=UPI0031E3620A